LSQDKGHQFRAHAAAISYRSSQALSFSEHISTTFQKKISQSDVDHMIDVLFADKMISESNNVITYKF